MKKPAPKKANAPLVIAIAALIVAIIGLPIMLLAWVEPHLERDQQASIAIETTTQLKDPLSRLDAIEQKVTQTNASLDELKPFINDVISHQFESASKLSAQALINHLPAVRAC